MIACRLNDRCPKANGVRRSTIGGRKEAQLQKQSLAMFRAIRKNSRPLLLLKWTIPASESWSELHSTIDASDEVNMCTESDYSCLMLASNIAGGRNNQKCRLNAMLSLLSDLRNPPGPKCLELGLVTVGRHADIGRKRFRQVPRAPITAVWGMHVPG